MTECQIEWHLADWMKMRGLRNKDLVYRTELHPVTISKLKHSKIPERIESSTLEKLCVALQCNPGDLIRFKHPYQKDTEFLASTYSIKRNQTFDVDSSVRQQHELRTSATNIMECTISLMELLEHIIPSEQRNQVTPYLVRILTDSNNQLKILNNIG